VRKTHGRPDKRPVEELLVSSLAREMPLAKLFIEKGLITREESMQNPPHHLNVRHFKT
jgi:hypothetical protein